MCFYNSTTSQPELLYYKDVLMTGLIFYKQLALSLRWCNIFISSVVVSISSFLDIAPITNVI